MLAGKIGDLKLNMGKISGSVIVPALLIMLPDGRSRRSPRSAPTLAARYNTAPISTMSGVRVTTACAAWTAEISADRRLSRLIRLMFSLKETRFTCSVSGRMDVRRERFGLVRRTLPLQRNSRFAPQKNCPDTSLLLFLFSRRNDIVSVWNSSLYGHLASLVLPPDPRMMRSRVFSTS